MVKLLARRGEDTEDRPPVRGYFPLIRILPELTHRVMEVIIHAAETFSDLSSTCYPRLTHCLVLQMAVYRGPRSNAFHKITSHECCHHDLILNRDFILGRYWGALSIEIMQSTKQALQIDCMCIHS